MMWTYFAIGKHHFPPPQRNIFIFSRIRAYVSYWGSNSPGFFPPRSKPRQDGLPLFSGFPLAGERPPHPVLPKAKPASPAKGRSALDSRLRRNDMRGARRGKGGRMQTGRLRYEGLLTRPARRQSLRSGRPLPPLDVTATKVGIQKGGEVHIAWPPLTREQARAAACSGMTHWPPSDG